MKEGLKIVRLGHDKDINQPVDMVDLSVNGKTYRFTEYFGGLRIMEIEGEDIKVQPSAGNVIILI